MAAVCVWACEPKSHGNAYRAALHQVPVSAPLDRIAFNILGPLPETENGKIYILVVSCYFTKWTEAYAIRDQTAQSVVDIMVNEFISRFRFPTQIHTDQGRNFKSGLFTELCKLLGIIKTRTIQHIGPHS